MTEDGVLSPHAVAGGKTTTIRWDEPISVGPATFVFEDHPDFAHVEGEILSVEPLLLHDLDAEHAIGLHAHYPSMPEKAELLRATFRVDGS